MKRDIDHFRGCLLGGAIGDALGWPVEFMKVDEFKKRFGNEDILRVCTCFEEKSICALPTICMGMALMSIHQ